MNYFIIGSYINEQNQHYCTVIALCNNIEEATQIQNNLKGDYFVKDSITMESEEMINKLSLNADLWNQLSIVKLRDFK